MNQHEKHLLKLGLVLTVAFSIAGQVLLLIGHDLREPDASFELIVFIMSASAIILAVIQSVAIERQMRAIRKASTHINEAVAELRQLVTEETLQNKILSEDLLLDKQALEALAKKSK